MSKKLNGLPNSLVASLLGTGRYSKHVFVHRYYDGGYMADWLANGAKKYNLNSITLDIKNGTVTPPELNIHPLVSNIQDLNDIITNELTANNFPSDFIKEAKIQASFSPDSRAFQIKAVVLDAEGKLYESTPKSDEALNPYFDVEEKMAEVNKRLNKKSFLGRLFG